MNSRGIYRLRVYEFDVVNGQAMSIGIPVVRVCECSEFSDTRTLTSSILHDPNSVYPVLTTILPQHGWHC